MVHTNPGVILANLAQDEKSGPNVSLHELLQDPFGHPAHPLVVSTIQFCQAPVVLQSDKAT